jgi:hypothetical protein
MKLSELKGKGGFVSSELVKVPVKWEHGGETLEFDVHVRQLPFGDVERIYIDPMDKERSKTAAMIAACIVLGEGDEPMTYKDAYQLHPGLATELMVAISKVQTPKA